MTETKTLKETLEELNREVVYKEKVKTAAKLDIGVSTVYAYLSGDIKSERTARKIIKELNNQISKR